MGAEPGVDAGRVERVRAAREEADELAVVELAEAHRAVTAPPHDAAAVLLGGYGRDCGLVEPHRADVPNVVHVPSAAAARLLVPIIEPFAVGQRGGGRPPAAAQEAAAAVDEERGEREREEEEGGEEGDGEEEAYGQLVVDGCRGAREGRGWGRGEVVALVAAGAADREAVERVGRAVEVDGLVAAAWLRPVGHG